MGLWSKIFNTDSAGGKSGAELDAELAAMNSARRDSGYYDADQYNQATANLNDSHIDEDAELSKAFAEGAAEGANNVKNAVGGTLNTVAGYTFKLIPWQVYAAAAVAAVVYFWPLLGPMLGARLKSFR